MSLNSVVEQALQHMVEEQLHQSALSAQENGERSMPHDEQRNQHGTHGDPREAATEPADQSFSLTDKAISALLNMGQVGRRSETVAGGFYRRRKAADGADQRAAQYLAEGTRRPAWLDACPRQILYPAPQRTRHPRAARQQSKGAVEGFGRMKHSQIEVKLMENEKNIKRSGICAGW